VLCCIVSYRIVSYRIISYHIVLYYYIILYGPGSLDGIATDYGQDGPGSNQLPEW